MTFNFFLLSLPPQCWKYRHGPLHLVCVVSGIKPRTSCILSECFTYWATSQSMCARELLLGMLGFPALSFCVHRELQKWEGRAAGCTLEGYSVFPEARWPPPPSPALHISMCTLQTSGIHFQTWHQCKMPLTRGHDSTYLRSQCLRSLGRRISLSYRPTWAAWRVLGQH